MNDPKQIAAALSAPFDAREVKFKPAVVSGNRALALAYVDARVIQDRLDAVLGVAGWQDEYEILNDGSVVCRLRLKIGDEWICKADVGSPSEQPNEGDRRKAAFSDALKRAAVKFGVGRFLYALPSQWVEFDPSKKRFIRPPQLPATASPAKPAPVPSAIMPRLVAFDTRLVQAGLSRPGECVESVRQQGIKVGLPDNVAAWPERMLGFATERAREFEAARRKTAANRNGKHERNGVAVVKR